MVARDRGVAVVISAHGGLSPCCLRKVAQSGQVTTALNCHHRANATIAPMTTNALRAIFDKTNGHCHFCGDPIIFEHRGWAESPDGHWEVDHVAQRHKGGAASAENCLPACTGCNRPRWSYTGDDLRAILLMGVVAQLEVRKGSHLGRQLVQRRDKRLEQNRARRERRTLQIEETRHDAADQPPMPIVAAMAESV